MPDQSLRSVVWRNYNILKALTRVNPVQFDMMYLRRALGDYFTRYRDLKDEVYEPTEDKCDCNDCKYIGRASRKTVDGERYLGPCKHRIRKMLMNPDLDIQALERALRGDG
jgi:hypothetical protein